MPSQCRLHNILTEHTLKGQELIVFTEVEHIGVANHSYGRVVSLFLVPVGKLVVVLEHFGDGFYGG